ncbi:glycoside hydrolase family 68 protein [Sphingomonas lenta]|uniref:Glycoside hydrolase 68 family protein n=1 Tax=Sphingomonas lenta TaxID=1141887 RepID=A0A2A2SCA9_9SPHN|nr:glycoside hydrolase family 68 protein [Sphingomonas lenta]PAX06641.1 glycoside hydrolase 68 family protein [Sphingomonas lenta]
MTPFRWTPEHVAAIGRAPVPSAPLITAAPRVIEGVDLWDHWPVLEEKGDLAEIAGGLLVVALSAPVLPDPDARHAMARLRLLHRRGETWRDLGPLLPDGFSPGSREWAGSAVVDRERRRLTLYFTAAGARGEAAVTFDQRLFETSAALDVAGDAVRLGDWTRPAEIVRPDGVTYETDMAGGGAVGTIKAFRDPYHLRQNGNDVVLFAASRAGAASAFNGLVGAAVRCGQGWSLLPPLVDATGVNNELERPHGVRHAGLTYLFWSTQAKVFAPGLDAPTGLYGLVAEGLDGPWRPLNGHGLVFANPAAAPAQAYSWQVLPDLSVWGFADMVGLAHPPRNSAEARAHFAGTPAPVLRLRLDGDRAVLA